MKSSKGHHHRNQHQEDEYEEYNGSKKDNNNPNSNSSKDLSENDVNKGESFVDLEHKNKRRLGGLGDVYQDKCTDGSTQILWDEAAILKLLDRSIIDSVSTDNSEGDMENDMLGSVKSLDWNDEPTEEQGGTESPIIIDGTTTLNLENKEDNSVNVAEENEWDRLLRVRGKGPGRQCDVCNGGRADLCFQGHRPQIVSFS